MNIDSIAMLYAPMLGQSATSTLDKNSAEAQVESMFLTTMLRSVHLFASAGEGDSSITELLNGVLPQMLANDLVARHQLGFGQVKLTANNTVTGDQK